MEKTVKLAESSDLYRNIDALSLSPRERMEAISALEFAEYLVSGLERVMKFVSSVSAPSVTASSPKLKHQ